MTVRHLTIYCCFIPLLCLFARSESLAQTGKSGWAFGVNTRYGFVYQHAASIGRLAQSHPYAVELIASQLTAGSKPWHRWYRYPEVGYVLGMVDFRNPILGKSVYGLIYLDKAMLECRAGSFRLKIGTGLTYNTNPYHPETNFQNNALGSRVMYAMQGELLWTFRLGNRWRLSTGASITHFSSGAFQIPNAGINVAAVKVGVSYVPVPSALRQSADSLSEPLDKRLRWQVSGAFFVKETWLPGGKKYPGCTLLVHASKPLNRKSALNVGVDGFYNTAVKYLITKDPDVDTLRRPDFKRVGLVFGHELLMGRVSLLTQLGVYVYRPYKIDFPIYQRFGLRYYVSDHVFASVALKSHFGTADFIEWTMGFRW